MTVPPRLEVMPMPLIRPSRRNVAFKTCTVCGVAQGIDAFAPTNSFFFVDGTLPICNDCVEKYLVDNDFEWDAVDKLCQCADVPFIPKEFERLRRENGTKVFPVYAKIFISDEYKGLGWDSYYKEFKDLEERGEIGDELPLISDERRRKLKEKWGPNYDDEALQYLENLYSGLMTTQNVNGALQNDQALKICKISYELDCRIREGTDFDKMLSSYDKLVKTAEFTPKNVKDINDFDSFGEVLRWFEKRGWRCKFHDGETRDIVDATIKNFQSYNQRLYINETDIGEEITRRIEALKTARELEDDTYGEQKEYDLDAFEAEGYEELLKDDGDFRVEEGDSDSED